MAKKKVNYKSEYYKHFDLIEGEMCVDEYEYIVNGKVVLANKIHHVFFGASKYDHIDNWMALSTENHDKAHQEDPEFNRYRLKEIHLEFMNNNPY